MDYARIEEIVSVLRDSCLTEMEVRQGDAALRLRRPARGAPAPHAGNLPYPEASPPAQHRTPAGEADGAHAAVTAGLVGVFHALREPIEEGAPVAERQVLGQIESMRLMNDCLAPAGGRVRAVHIRDGQPVEYGQILFEIAPGEP